MVLYIYGHFSHIFIDKDIRHLLPPPLSLSPYIHIYKDEDV